MRTANIVVTLLGGAGVAIGAAIAWRWHRLPMVATDRPAIETSGAAALDGLRTLAVAASSGAIAGLLVAGLGGRLVMRILGATSGRAAQGRVTDADEVVGRITADGTLGIIIFVGLAGGLVAGAGYVVLRRWLPTRAGFAGVVVGLVLLGTIGVGDAMSPENNDFVILGPTWLAITLIVAIALLFGVTFTSLAARLDAGMPTLGTRPRDIPSHAGLLTLMLPPVAAVSALYVAGRAALRGRLGPVLERPQVQRAGHAIVALAVVVTVFTSIRAIVEIASA